MNNEFLKIIIDEIFLIKNKILAFIDCRLCVIKQIHKQLMGGLDVIMIIYFYQTPLTQGSWISNLIIFGVHMSSVINYNKLCDKIIINS
jgi:hypothetical protein